MVNEGEYFWLLVEKDEAEACEDGEDNSDVAQWSADEDEDGEEEDEDKDWEDKSDVAE